MQTSTNWSFSTTFWKAKISLQQPDWWVVLKKRENIKVLLFCHKREQEGWTCLPIKILNNPRHSCTNEQFPCRDNWYIFKIIKEICHHQKENDSSTTKLTSMEYDGLCVGLCVCGWVCVCYYSVMSDPMDCSPPGSSVHGILQARILEWVAIPFSRVSSWPRGQTQVSCISGRFFTVWVIWMIKKTQNSCFENRHLHVHIVTKQCSMGSSPDRLYCVLYLSCL